MKSTFIIAEAGVNHNGSFHLAKKMIEIAAEAGADAIKFQTFKAKNLVTFYAPKAEYQKTNTYTNGNQLEMIEKLELSDSEFIKLANICKSKNIKFMSSPFDLESIEFLDKIGMEIFKIPSGEITNLPYLKQIAQKNKPVILSTGMADLGEIEDAIDILLSGGLERDDITILHCNTEYPTPFEDVNLKAIQTLKSAFPGIKVGYSDHTIGIEIAIAAVAIGASVIEKHFTINKDLQGPDHKSSLDPIELTNMVQAIRNVEKAFGTGIKKPSKSEIKNIKIVRKSIVASRDIKKGEIFSEYNITTKRPGSGISPMYWNEVIGKKAPKDFKKDELIVL